MWRTPGVHVDPAQMWHSTAEQAGANYVGFEDDEVDRLIGEAANILDPEERHQKYREVMEILWEKQPYTFLYVRPRLALVHRRIHDVRETLFGWEHSDWWVEEASSR